MTIKYFEENWLTKPNVYIQEPLESGNLKLTEILPYNPNDDTMTRTLYNGGIVKGRRSDYLNINNRYFYHYECIECGDICVTTRHPGKWPKRGMTCGSPDSPCFVPNRDKYFAIARQKTCTRENPSIDDSGYVVWYEDALDNKGNKIPQYDKNGNKSGYKNVKMFEHRVVMEEHLGRKLKDFRIEQVHHIDMIKTNNNIDNLWLCTDDEHTRAHQSMNKITPLLYIAKRQGKTVFIDFDRERGIYFLTT